MLLGVGALLLGAFMAWQSVVAYKHLRSVSQEIPALRQQVTAGDAVGASETAAQLQEDTRAAWRAVHGPHWALAAMLPKVGPNVSAVQTVTESLDDLAANAVPHLLNGANALDPESLAPVRGRVRLRPIEEAAPYLVAAQRVVDSAADRLGAIETSLLVEQLRVPVSKVVEQVQAVDDVTGPLSKATQLLPSMLGGDGPRRYLVLAQNNAEPRALGGFSGALILLSADNGRIQIVEHRSAGSLGYFDRPAMRLSQAELGLYGDQLGRFIGNVTGTPDFPRASRLARAMWREKTGVTVDGVAAVDPYTLQLLLEATGPVPMPDGRTMPSGRELTADNAVKVLLNEVYTHIRPDRQNAFYADAASTVFRSVIAGNGDARGIAKALATAAEQGRLMLWSAQNWEEAVLSGSLLSGELRGDKDGEPVVGVYLHDRTQSKLGYYERLQVQARRTSCDTEGAGGIALTVKLSSEVPKNGAGLTDDVTGAGRRGVPRGDVLTDVYVYAPRGGVVQGFHASEGSDGVSTQVHSGLHVVSRGVLLAPGESVTLEYDLSVPAGLEGDPVLRMTPGPYGDQFSGSSVACGA